MKMTKRWALAIGLVIAWVTFVPWSTAGTTVMDVQLNEAFTGTIATAGVDTVEARFFAAQGASLRLAVRATGEATIVPTAIIRDSSGTPLSSGTTQEIAALPVANLLHYFTIQTTGMYTAEIGGSSGSGEFWARLAGSSVQIPMSAVSGSITHDLTGAPIEGASVFVDGVLFATTNAGGSFTGQLVAGSYSVRVEATGYETRTLSLIVAAGSPAVLDVELTPLVPVLLDTSVTGDATPGASVMAMVDVQAPPGTLITSITWTQESGPSAGIAGGGTDTATVTLGTEADYRDELILKLSEPAIGPEQLPPGVPVPAEEFPGGLQDRLQVVGINPLALEEAGLVVLKVEVVTDLGTFSEEVEIHAHLPWKVAPGLRNVPQGIPVLLRAKESAGYSWLLMPPPGSSATLTDPLSRHPYFSPDIPGRYELEVSDPTRGVSSTLEVYAGTWRGTIVDQDIDGRPVADTACTFCHNDTMAPDKFTDWAQTGHAEIFTNNLNTSPYYSSNCFACHSVGYDPEVDNGGFDEADDYQAFLAAGLLSSPGDNWTTVLDQFPETARMANAQCENCHGPQDSNAHGFAGPLGEPRVDLSADVCATCHGEPLRHARFQQWQLSGHANYELAISRGGSGSCSRCHTANGFLAWLPILLDNDPNTDPLDDVTVTWTEDETHPQTCATCHDPHASGTTSGSDPNATVRISGDTPPLIAGFQATDVGRGAICMTCHNSRRGLRNDSVFDGFSTGEKARAPHGSAQGDVLMGQNAYFVAVGNRGGHSFVEDICVTCHMEATPPPALLSYNLGGTNHTFYAEKTICADCHSPHLNAADVQNGVESLLGQVAELIGDRVVELMDQLIAAGNTIDLNGDATITDAAAVTAIEFGETRGRQAITVTLSGVGTFGPMRVTDIDVVDGSPAVIGTLYDFAADDLMKAGWNWNLVNNDGSLGVHNPFFASGALIAARNALVALSGGGGTPSIELLSPRELSTKPGRSELARPDTRRR